MNTLKFEIFYGKFIDRLVEDIKNRPYNWTSKFKGDLNYINITNDNNYIVIKTNNLIKLLNCLGNCIKCYHNDIYHPDYVNLNLTPELEQIEYIYYFSINFNFKYNIYTKKIIIIL